MPNAEQILKDFAPVKTRRGPYENQWELIARYIFQRKQGFGTINSPGEFYEHDDVCDNTAGLALHSMVSSIDGALWKNGGRTFRIVRPRRVRESAEVKEFYEEINHRITEQMEHEKAAFGTARQEALLEGGAFGTDAIGTFRSPPGSRHKVEYRAMPLKNLYIVEDARGCVIKEYYEFEYTAAQLVGEYKEWTPTEKVKQLLTAGDATTKLKVLWVNQPREDADPALENVRKYSYESIHILEDEKVILRNSGYNGNPITVSRFYKNEGEEYGRSPGHNALNPAMELCAVVEILTMGAELSALPPWYVLDDGTFGNGTIDRSAGAVIPIDATSSRITGMAPIGQIGTVGPLTALLKLAEILIAEINQHFLVDKLTDLNNTTRMTLGEAQIRNELRAENTGAIFSRQIDEKLVPTIRRTIGILEEDGTLGVDPESALCKKMLAEGKKPLLIPPEVLEILDEGGEIYPIEFISPAARILRSEEVRGLISLMQFGAGFSGVMPENLLWLDEEKIMPLVRDLYGAPPEALVSLDKFLEKLKAYKDSQAMQAQLQAAQVTADVQAKNASANQQNAQATATTGGMNGLLNGGGAGYAAMAM